MEIQVFNRELELQGIIESFTSLIWRRRYFKSGDFELQCPFTEENLNLLKLNNLIYINSNDAGVIDSIEITLDDTGMEIINVKGKFATTYLARRIVWGKEIHEGPYEDLMYKLVNYSSVDVFESRKIPNLAIAPTKGLPNITSYQNSYGNVLENIEILSETSGYGFKINFNTLTKTLTFEIYEGRNLTINQIDFPPCIFSKEFENFYEQTYSDMIENFKNTCLIAGAGEDEARKTTSIISGTGLDRYELFVDAREISDKETINDVEQEIPWARYEPMLLQKGYEKLGEHKTVQTFESVVNTVGNLRYKEDYDLGDIVTCHDKRWGIQLDTRITEIEEIYEKNELQINVTFGNNIPTLVDKIKARMR